MSLPLQSRPADEILAELDALKQHDVRWKDGRAFTLAYYAGPDVAALGDEAYRRFSSDNALNTDAFPSLRKIQSDVVAMVGRAPRRRPEAAGFMTTGGTESLLMAVKAARERGRSERDVTRPNVVLPTSAHAAFEKGCHYFGLESRRVDVRADWRADVDAMADAIDDDTVLVVGSAPQYPQGVIDPIPDDRRPGRRPAASTATSTPAWAGWCSPTWRGSARTIPPWNFSVPGVTSISVDLHKFGYTTQGRVGHRPPQP